MDYDLLIVSVVFKHLLVVTSALARGPGPHELAHSDVDLQLLPLPQGQLKEMEILH